MGPGGRTRHYRLHARTVDTGGSRHSGLPTVVVVSGTGTTAESPSVIDEFPDDPTLTSTPLRPGPRTHPQTFKRWWYYYPGQTTSDVFK